MTLQRSLLTSSGGAVLLLAVLAVFAPPALADTLNIEPEDSRIAFTLHSTFHEVEGLFTITGGRIVFDPGTGSASGRITIAATSGTTDHNKRDKKMHKKVLESEMYPDIVFSAQHVEGVVKPEGDSDVTLVGTLELHGDRHEVEIPAHVHLEGEHLTGAGGFTVPFVAWGMKDPSILMFRVAKEVQIHLTLSGTIDRGPVTERLTSAD